MICLYAMRRANGDWYALDDQGSWRVPVFKSDRDAMMARSRDSGMECFRPVVLDAMAFENLTTTDEGKACFWLVDEPEKISRGRRLNTGELAVFMSSQASVNKESANDLARRAMRNDIAALEGQVPETS